MSTRKTLRGLLAPYLDGETGSITSGTATTAVLAGLVGTGADNQLYVNAQLVMPDAATAADQSRVVTSWVASTGTATFATRSDTTYTNETYAIWRRNFTHAQVNAAFDRVQAISRKTVRNILPTTGKTLRYPYKSALPWIRTSEDIDQVSICASPNLCDNSALSNWRNGPSLAPDRWVLAGSGGTVARASTQVAGDYSVTLTRVGTDTTLAHTIGLLAQDLLSKEITFGAWCRATVASRAYVGISTDGGSTWSEGTAHTGGGADEFLTVTVTVPSTATGLAVRMAVKTGNTSADWSNPVGVIGSSIPVALRDAGDAAYTESPIAKRVWNDAVEIDEITRLSRQLVIYSAQPFPAFSGETDSTDCPDDVMVFGALKELAELHPEGVDQTFSQQVSAIWTPRYMRASQGLRKRPVKQDARSQIYVRSA